MPVSAGINAQTGQSLTDFDHVRQSISVILRTAVGSRVMRREFGSEVMELIDRPMTTRVILAVYAATANALRKWEPRFHLLGCELVQVTVDGTLALNIIGQYLPRGHLGDFTPANDDPAVVMIPLGRAARGQIARAA